MTTTVHALSHERPARRVDSAGALPVPRLPEPPSTAALTASSSPIQYPASSDSPTRYLPSMGSLVDSPGPTAQHEAVSIRNERAVAAAAAKSREQPTFELMERILRVLRRL